MDTYVKELEAMNLDELCAEQDRLYMSKSSNWELLSFKRDLVEVHIRAKMQENCEADDGA